MGAIKDITEVNYNKNTMSRVMVDICHSIIVKKKTPSIRPREVEECFQSSWFKITKWYREEPKIRIIYATFDSNFSKTIVSVNSFNNIRDKSDIITFYNKLSSLARHIQNHNVLIIDWDMIAEIGKNENN